MKAHSDTTWWKRLFTVGEVATGIAMLLWFLYLFAEARDKTLNAAQVFFILLFVLGPVVILHLIRLAVCYVIEGRQ